MMDHASPATRLHDVVVVQEQTHVEWRASRGEIRHGRVIVVPGTAPPDGFFAEKATYCIRATDGGGRARVFPSLALSSEDSRPPTEYVFD
jgi:hypothetical protein